MLYATETGSGSQKGGQRIARGHMAPHTTENQGAHAQGIRGYAHIFG
jgi:hypothetical protein